MKKLLFGIVISFPAICLCQSFTSYSLNNITIRSDIFPKTTIISNRYPSRIGDISPLLGIALWTDAGEKFECRSLIEFNMDELPEFIHSEPTLVEKAELILYPKLVEENGSNLFIFSIKRIQQPWIDSIITWNTQPLTASEEIIVKLKPTYKRILKIDVTKQVVAMLKSGNFGFMLTAKDTLDKETRWFGSSKNDDLSSRPELIIRFVTPVKYNYANKEPVRRPNTVAPVTITNPPPNNRNQ